LYNSALEAGYLPDQFWNFTLREYLHHSRHFENKDRAAWLRTASIQALLANINRRKGSQPFTADDFNPYREHDQRQARQKKAAMQPTKKPEWFAEMGNHLKP
jgi:hypothetical protein